MTSNEHLEPQVPRAGDGALVVWRLAVALGLFLLVWLVFFLIDSTLPGLRSGSDQVEANKRALIREGAVLDADAPVRVVVVGNSRVLAGFVPAQFDKELGDGVASYNLGLPGIRRFVSEVEVIAGWEPPPTHVLVVTPWKTKPEQTTWELLHDDDALMDIVFPFRRLPRNAVLFAVRSRSKGGPVQFYRHVLKLLDDVERDRGYHFIESQSRNKRHQLPADFKVARDDPTVPYDRKVPSSGPELERLLELRDAAGFTLMVIPEYRRIGEAAPAVTPPRPGLDAEGVQVVGPDYWRYANSLFSDPVHLNREGATRYTHDLAELLRPVLLGAGQD